MSRFLAIAAILLAALAVLAAPAGAALPYAPETPVATGQGAQQAPSVGRYGWPLAWENDASALWHVAWLIDGQPQAVDAASGVQRHPAVAENRLVYEDDRIDTWDLYVSELPLLGYPSPTQQDVALATGAGDQVDPAISGNNVVYESNASGNWDICTRPFSGGAERRLTSNTANQIDPAIEGDDVVWADHRNGNWDIYRHDLGTGRTTRLTTSSANQKAPQIGHGVVVYQDDRNGNWDVYAYTLATGRERRLTTDKHDQTAPSIGTGRTVVYEDDRRGAADVYLCDLTTGANRRVTDEPAAQTGPTVANDVVAWTDARSGDADVYSCRVHYPGLGLNAPSGTPRYGSTVRLTGFLGFARDAPVTAKVTISGDGSTHTVGVQGLDDGDQSGEFTYALRSIARKVTLHATYQSDATQLPAAPITVAVTPTALLSRPALKVIRTTSLRIPLPSLSVSGVLKPQHGGRRRKLEPGGQPRGPWVEASQDGQGARTRPEWRQRVLGEGDGQDQHGLVLQDQGRPRGRRSRTYRVGVQRRRARVAGPPPAHRSARA